MLGLVGQFAVFSTSCVICGLVEVWFVVLVSLMLVLWFAAVGLDMLDLHFDFGICCVCCCWVMLMLACWLCLGWWFVGFVLWCLLLCGFVGFCCDCAWLLGLFPLR